MKFSKMQGIGNDYIYVNCFEETVEDPSALAVRLSDRHFGIGSDGLILIRPTPNGDAMMDLYNADGSRAMMCGNGIRCVGKYVYEKGIARRDVLKIDTLSGVKTLYLTVEDGKVNSVKVAMGEPEFMPERIPVAGYDLPVLEQPVEVCGESFKVTCVSMGNPHAVTVVEDTASFPVEKIGPFFENHEMFPDRVNTEFVQLISRSEMNMRVWERGSGETWACGTGTCASVVACVINGYTDEHVLVHLLGGDLQIFYDRAADTVWMTGPAAVVFDGEIDVSEVDR